MATYAYTDSFGNRIDNTGNYMDGNPTFTYSGGSVAVQSSTVDFAQQQFAKTEAPPAGSSTDYTQVNKGIVTVYTPISTGGQPIYVKQDAPQLYNTQPHVQSSDLAAPVVQQQSVPPTVAAAYDPTQDTNIDAVTGLTIGSEVKAILTSGVAYDPNGNAHSFPNLSPSQARALVGAGWTMHSTVSAIDNALSGTNTALDSPQNSRNPSQQGFIDTINNIIATHTHLSASSLRDAEKKYAIPAAAGLALLTTLGLAHHFLHSHKHHRGSTHRRSRSSRRRRR